MFRRILVPLDGTPGSETAVPYAIDLASALDAEVVLCHVITVPSAANASGQAHEPVQYLSGVAKRFSAAGIIAKTNVRRGDPPIEIKKAALDWAADSIVMATRSRKGVERLVLGSVAEAVVRDSRLPVLLVSSRKKKAARAPATQLVPNARVA